jgi:hypothetical protein
MKVRSGLDCNALMTLMIQTTLNLQYVPRSSCERLRQFNYGRTCTAAWQLQWHCLCPYPFTTVRLPLHNLGQATNTTGFVVCAVCQEVSEHAAQHIACVSLWVLSWARCELDDFAATLVHMLHHRAPAKDFDNSIMFGHTQPAETISSESSLESRMCLTFYG